MRVKLMVLKGSNAGTEIKIPTPKCIIGRSDDCHLRPKSDAVSRRHCAILVKKSSVVIRDLKSRNGTYVNGEKISGDYKCSGGEVVKVGPLQFELLIDHSLGGDKKPVVKDVKDAATRAMSATAGDDDISGWLEEADQMDMERRMADPDTRQFKLDETNQVALDDEDTDLSGVHTQLDDEADSDDSTEKKDSSAATSLFGKKKKFGKLPSRPSTTTDNSRDAAADMLKKFFNRR